jgi:hypothetical protein
MSPSLLLDYPGRVQPENAPGLPEQPLSVHQLFFEVTVWNVERTCLDLVLLHFGHLGLNFSRSLIDMVTE